MSDLKCLINSNKIIAYGPYCWVSPASTDLWILDSASTIADIQVVAKNMDISLPGKKKDDMLSFLGDYLQTTNIPTIEEKIMEQTTNDIVVAGFESGKTDNEILAELVMAGVEFGNAKKAFNKAVEDNKLRLSAKERKEIFERILQDWTTDSVEEVLSMVSKLKDAAQATEGQALAAIRKHAKENGWEVPKAPKSSKPRESKFSKMADWVLANPDCSSEELEAAAVELLGEKSAQYASVFQHSIDFAVNYAAAKGWIEVSEEEAA